MEHIKITIEYKRYICEICGKKFQSGYILNKHKKDCKCEENNTIDINNEMENFKLKISNTIEAINLALNEFSK